jgi:hypothetical protein
VPLDGEGCVTVEVTVDVTVEVGPVIVVGGACCVTVRVTVEVTVRELAAEGTERTTVFCAASVAGVARVAALAGGAGPRITLSTWDT